MDANLPQIRDYFGMTAAQFRTEWMVLDDAEKAFFKAGVGEVLGL